VRPAERTPGCRYQPGTRWRRALLRVSAAKGIKMKNILRPSHEEYVKFVEKEFSFLEIEFGYQNKWDAKDKFKVVYTGQSISVHIWGWGYGESGHISINLGEEQLPFTEFVTPFKKKLTESTGKPQLDDFKEYAYRLRNECQEILKGNLSPLDPYRPFPNAEKLWFDRAFAKIIELVESNKKPLSKKWQTRYEYALKNVKNA
jgi:hypothetical protein